MKLSIVSIISFSVTNGDKQTMRVLVVSNMYPSKGYPSYGIFVQRFCNQLMDLGVSINKSVILKSKIGAIKLMKYLWFYISTFFYCISGKYDVVYIHYASHSSLPVLIAAYFKRLNIYVNVHGSDVFPVTRIQKLMQVFTRSILKKSSKVIVPSIYFKNQVKAKYKVPDNKIYIFHSGGINENIFYPDRCGKENVESVPIFGFASRLIGGKGWRCYIEAIALMEQKNLKARYFLVGEGPDYEEMLQLITKLHLQNIVHISPLLSQDKLAEFYRTIDFFVFPTRLMESLGLVAVEAMACGTPVIAGTHAALGEYMLDGKNGFTFHPSSSEQCAEAMCKAYYAYQDKSEMEMMRSSAIATSSKYMSKETLKQLRNAIYG